jgi:hypothetical protein
VKALGLRSQGENTEQGSKPLSELKVWLNHNVLDADGLLIVRRGDLRQLAPS